MTPMHDLVPNALFVSRRALCPACGAPAPLEGEGAQVLCKYCGAHSRVERRLRTKEPDDRPDHKPTEWVPSHLLSGDEVEHGACGGCGAEVEIEDDQSFVTCRACGAECKVERRMRRVEMPLGLEVGEDKATVALLHKLKTSTDLAERVALAKDASDSWGSANDTMAGRVGELLEVLDTADLRLQHAAGDILCKLLCQGNPLYVAAVLAAAEPHLFKPTVSRVLFWELGLGPALCMKRLLDAADVHGQRGDLLRASTALWGANTLLGRNYPEHPMLAQIILYRLLYLHGPVLGWAIKFIQGPEAASVRRDTGTLLRFVDDCALERPSLVPEIRRAFYEIAIENAAGYRARLDLYAALTTKVAKNMLLELLPPPPKGTALRVVKETHDLLVAALDDPDLAPGATIALVAQMKEGIPQAIHDLVKKRKDALPDAIRRAYIEKVKESPHLSPLPPRYWESEKPAPRAPEIEEALRLENEGIHLAVDTWRQEEESLRAYWKIIQRRTPLMVAAGNGDVAKIEALLAKGDVNAANPAGRTALMFAAENGHAGAITALGGDRSLRDSDGKTAIVLAAECGHAEAVRALMGDASLDQEAFAAAFHAEKTAILALLLEAGVDPDALEEDGSTPLMACAKRGQADLARVLLDARAMIDHQDNTGRSALMHAAEAGRAEAVRLLLERKANVELTTPEDEGALALAARAGHAAAVELLAGRVADVNARGASGKSALAIAEEKGHAGVVAALRSRGASVAGDTTLLVEAVEKRDLARVRALLDAGMTPDVRDKQGTSVLEKAIYKSQPDLFWLLLDRGATPDADVLHRLVVVWWPEAIERILDSGVEADATDERGETALMIAATKGALDIAEILLARGADPRRKDKRGDDAVAYARMRAQNEAMIKRLGG